MRMFTFSRCLPLTLVSTLGLSAVGLCHAAPVTINSPFINFEHDGINSLGFATGDFLRFGASRIIPNGSTGTTGVAKTVNLSTGAVESRTIGFTPSPLLPNFFSRSIAINPDLLGPWTLTFTNGTDSASRTVQLPAGAALAPFVDSITLSGTSANPTFSWAAPAGATVNGYRVSIYDKSLINFDPAKGPKNLGQVTSRNLTPDTASYTVQSGDFTVPGYGFALNKHYSIEISVLQTDDGSSTNFSNSNLSSFARTYADFTPTASGGPVVNLPVALASGAYQFNLAVQPNQTYYIDPDVAVGYDYATGAGDPNFKSVVLPTGIGDGHYQLWGFNGNTPVLLVDDLAGGTPYSFASGGVSRFRVTGIETSAGLDPTSTTAFVTGLDFVGSGKFTGTQTPITLSVPEPATVALWALGLVAIRQRRYRARI